MSFGFSIGDIIQLIELTTDAYTGWKDACGSYAHITDDLFALRTLLTRIQTEVDAPHSLFSANKDDLQSWEPLSRSCHGVVTELAGIVSKYRSLSTNRAKNWDRIRLGNKNLDGLNTRLLKRIESVSAFATVMGISSQGRVENVLFPALLRKMDGIAAEMRRGSASICTMTTYEGDDKGWWRDFRREMVRENVRSRDLHRYKDALKMYAVRLHNEGMLDEEGGVVDEAGDFDNKGYISEDKTPSVDVVATQLDEPGNEEGANDAPESEECAYKSFKMKTAPRQSVAKGGKPEDNPPKEPSDSSGK